MRPVSTEQIHHALAGNVCVHGRGLPSYIPATLSFGPLRRLDAAKRHITPTRRQM